MQRRALVLAGVAPGHAATPVTVRFPRPGRDFDIERWYPLRLLREALLHSELSHRLEPSDQVMGQSRMLRELELGTGSVDVAITMTNPSRERELLPIRIPLHRGLFGWRLLFARPEMREAFAGVRTLAELKRFRFLQGADWPDTQILQANGLGVLTSTSYDGLFRMLMQGQGDALPRSVAEIWWEQERRGERLVIEPHLVLHYPTAVYFFVHRSRIELAAAIEQGLRRMLANGRFEQIFMDHHRQALERSELAKRRVIRLQNPQLPPRTPSDQAELWFKV